MVGVSRKEVRREMALTNERLLDILGKGCPQCGGKNLAVDCTEQMRYLVSVGHLSVEHIAYELKDHIAIVSNDYIICLGCYWQEPEA